jgi:hypothetical protein
VFIWVAANALGCEYDSGSLAEPAAFDGNQNPVDRDSANNPLLQLDLQRFSDPFF